jgi:hypothetical protein
MVRDYGAATYSWPAGATTNSTQGTYLIGVWAKAAGSPNAYDAYAYLAYVIKNPCDTAALSAAPASPQNSGTVTLTATAAGCTGALFQFYMQAPGGGWVAITNFSATNTFTFNAAAATNGRYMFGVWAKGPTSATSYDSYALITYYIGT